MFETQRSRGRFLVALALVLSGVSTVATFFSERAVEEEGRAAADALATELGRYGSLLDIQIAMHSGEPTLSSGASLATDELRVVAYREVRTLMAVRCVRVIATARDVSAPLTIERPSIEDRSCGW